MNLESKEFYINMKEKDIPFWNPLYSYDDQDDDVKQFWNNEAVKLMNGVTVNGVYIHPWLYWHLNFWKMMLDVGDDRIPGLSELRDNEWFFAEILKQAEEENKGIFMFGTRRFGKALLNSEIVYMEDKEMRICDLQIGDRIYDESGKLVTVEGVYPQGKVFTYRVKFEDGRNVICCGDHLWRVMYKGVWYVKTLKNIIMSDFNNMYIPISEAIDYKERRLPLNPSAYGTMLAAHLMSSSGMDILYDANVARQYLRSSIRQKKEFTESFIRAFQGVVTDDEKIQVSYEDMDVIRFVQRMFWAYGWYAQYEKGVLALTSRREGLRISSIEVYGKYDATCIRVSNDSHLFLTTNYVVTHNSAIMSSLLARNATLTYNLSHNVLGSSKEDLMNLSEYLEFGLDNLPPFLKINRTGNDWSKEVILGVRNTRNERDVHARIRITNLNSGQTSASLKPAGNTPYTSIYDEVGKFPFLEAYLAGLPAHKMKGRMRGMIIASGCVVKDTVIYEGYKKKIKVQDVKLGSLIIGYNKTTMTTRKNRVEWVKPPAEKLCFRIRASKFGVSKMLDCSYDHPFLCKEPNGRDKLYEGYVPAIRLVPGDKVAVVDGGVGTADWFVVESVRQLGMREVYNVRVDGTSNYLANDFVTHNTGGNVEKSRDAQKVMNNPSQYGFIVMDYSLLGKHTMNPTWRICKSGIFVPGQMSHAYEKKKTNLAEYLGVKNANSLKKISIQVTDFDKTTKVIQSRLDELAKGDRELFVQEKMAYPLTVDDCFLNSSVNRFPVDDAMIHKNRLLEEGRRGKAVTIYQVDNKKIGWNFSDKQIAPYPFKGGNIDSPVIIYEDPPEEGGNLSNYVYSSGLDPYKSDKSSTESLGAFYIFKRMVGINDPFANKIVASYVSRPPSSDDFCRVCEMLQEAYGAMCLMENADRMYEMYLARRNKDVVLLEDGERLANKIIRPGTRQNNRLGLPPTVPNQRMLFNAVIQYCWEPVVVGYTDEGEEITQKGIYRIDDIELLEEIIAFGPNVNTDRIIAFGHALLLARYYDDMNYMPNSSTQKANEEKRSLRRYSMGGFSTVRHNPFTVRNPGFSNFVLNKKN